MYCFTSAFLDRFTLRDNGEGITILAVLWGRGSPERFGRDAARTMQPVRPVLSSVPDLECHHVAPEHRCVACVAGYRICHCPTLIVAGNRSDNRSSGAAGRPGRHGG